MLTRSCSKSSKRGFNKQYVNQELPDVQAGFRKDRGTRDQIANICWIIEKARESREISISALLTSPKPLCGSPQTGKFFKKWEYQTTLPPEKPVCRSRNNRTEHKTIDWFKIGKRVPQGYILSPCLFNFYAEYIVQNAGRMKHKLESRLLGEISLARLLLVF